MELLEQTDEYIVIELEYSERFHIETALHFFIGPYTGGISDEKRQYAFSESHRAEVLHELLDPGWRERIARQKIEREEARARGEKWRRTGKGWSKTPFLIRLLPQDLLGIKRVIDLVIPNSLFEYYTDSETVEDMKEIRRSVVQILEEVQE